MGTFLDKLDALADRKPNMKRAAENIKSDLESDLHLYGISQKLQTSLDESIENGDEIRDTVESHRSIKRPELHVEAEIQPNQIRRVMSLHSFSRYHMAPADSSFELSGAANELLEDVVIRYFPELREGRADKIEETIDSEELAGTTGPPRKPTWWTWLEENDSHPADGETYMLELALSENERRFAQTSGIVVEVTFEKRDLENVSKIMGANGIPFFRPTGLDSFSEDTPFRPNLKPEPFGRTCPTPPATKERPEAVSESVAYENLSENVKIILTGFRY